MNRPDMHQMHDDNAPSQRKDQTMKRETRKASEHNKDAVRWADAALIVNDEMGKVIAEMTNTPSKCNVAPTPDNTSEAKDLTTPGQVERFRLDAMREFYARPAGTWVRLSDYEALSTKLEAAEAELVKARTEIAELEAALQRTEANRDTAMQEAGEEYERAQKAEAERDAALRLLQEIASKGRCEFGKVRVFLAARQKKGVRDERAGADIDKDK